MTYVAEETHKLQNNSIQTWGRKKLPKLPSFADLFTLCAFLSLYNENYARLLVDLSNQFHNDKKFMVLIDKILELIIALKRPNTDYDNKN